MPWDRVHDEAEVLEHYISEELERLIAAKLGEPELDPHGDPIPTRDLAIAADDTVALDRARAREHGDLRARLRLRREDAALPRRARDPARRRDCGSPTREPFGGPVFVEVDGNEHALGAASWRRRCGWSRRAAHEPRRWRRPSTAPPRRAAPERRRRWDGVEDVLPGEAAVARAARRSLDGHSRGTGPDLAVPRPGLHRRRRLHRPRQLRHQHRRRRQVRLPAALGRARGEPDRDAGPDPVGEARDRHRQEPRRALPRALLRAAPRSASGCRPSWSRWRLRHRRGRRRRARPQPALRHPALPGRADRRRRRLRDPRPAAEGLPPARGGDLGAGRRRRRWPSPSSSSTPTRRRRGRQAPRSSPASPAPRASCSRPGSSARR